MITLKDIQTRELTTDELRSIVTSYEAKGIPPTDDISFLDAEKVYSSFRYPIHSFSRLQVSDTVDPEKILVTIARKHMDNMYGVVLTFKEIDGDVLMTMAWAGKHAVLSDKDGNIIADGNWREEIRPRFKSLKAVALEAKKAEKAMKTAAEITSESETTVKAAAAPKKTKKAKKNSESGIVVVSSTPVEEPATPDVLTEVEEVLANA